MNFPTKPGHVVVGLDTNNVVYAFYNQGNKRVRQDFTHDPINGHIFWTVNKVVAAAETAEAEAISFSSSVDFPEEYGY